MRVPANCTKTNLGCTMTQRPHDAQPTEPLCVGPLPCTRLPVAAFSLRTAVTASTTSFPKKSESAPTILDDMAVLAAAISVSAPSEDVGMVSCSRRYLQAWGGHANECVSE